MKQITCTMISAFIFFFAASTFAGDEICNGGDLVLCPRERPRLLDLFERNILYNLTTPINEPHLSRIKSVNINDVAQEIIAPLEHLSPEIHSCLSSYLTPQGFWTEARLIPNVEMRDIRDEQYYVIPKSCQKVQVAMQLRTSTIGPYRYMISENLWNIMDEYQRAGLILHEIILRNFILNPSWGEKTTSVRYFTAAIMSAEISEMTPAQFQQIVADINFKCHPMR
ncbi:hypothetical protein [Bdellovibrio sp. HCB337]|uniref:hypothetical protein n=1 Tax=Bdellovibrio sp. HCB337 TaxID=3394358 RepID=UPI0039A47FE2